MSPDEGPPPNGPAPAVDPLMLEFYTAGNELGRLETRNPLEFERSKVILAERVPGPGRLIDVGGGPGTYASWFAGRGYEVDLVDPVPLHVEAARSTSAAGTPFRAQLGDARSLPFADSVADAVVMMGPLFHLVTDEDRQRALAEAYRVLRPGGTIAVSAMGRFFLFGHAVATNAIRDPQVRSRIVSMVDSGQRPGDWGPFPAYAHRPQGLAEEVGRAGFCDVEVLAIEGFFHLLGDIARRLADEASREALLELLSRYEADPGLVEFSGHLLAVARRPLEATEPLATGGGAVTSCRR